MADVILDTLWDVIRLLPFLLLTYLAMEWLEHRTVEKTEALVRRAGNFGPVIGGVLGVVPQCGFSAAAANLYTGRVITKGTLLAVYLSTSDEMLPVLLSERAPVDVVIKLLLAKVVIGMLAGAAVDFPGRRKQPLQGHIRDICEQEHCRCEKGILRSALFHTAQITLFLLLVTLALNSCLHIAGEGVLAMSALHSPILGTLAAGLVGLIPNCAGSVVITKLYLEGIIGIGATLAGLLAGSGVGLLVLFRVNRNRGENLRILGLLYGVGITCGVAAELLF